MSENQHAELKGPHFAADVFLNDIADGAMRRLRTGQGVLRARRGDEQFAAIVTVGRDVASLEPEAAIERGDQPTLDAVASR